MTVATANVDCTSAPLAVERHDGVLQVRMNAPAYRNALSAAMKDALLQAVHLFVSDAQLRCLVLTGTGTTFCAGGDLRDLADERHPQAVRRRMAKSHALVQALTACEKPVITAVNGAAIGAGFSLALAGDIVVASDTAYFLAGFSTMGLLPDLGLLYHLPRAVGMPVAKDWLLNNRRVAAQQALAHGLVSRLYPAASFNEDVMQLAAAMAAGPAVAMGLTKTLLAAAGRDDLQSFLVKEALAQAAAFASEDFLEGNRAFREKRAPRFVGR